MAEERIREEVKKQLSLRVYSSTIAVLWLFVASGPMAAVQEGANYIQYKDSKITAVVEKMPLKFLLEAVSRQTGVQFLLDRELRGTASTRFRELPLAYGIKRILHQFNHAMFWEKGIADEVRLSHIKVFRKGFQATADYLKIDGSAAPSTTPELPQVAALATTSGNATPSAPAASVEQGGGTTAAALSTPSAQSDEEPSSGNKREINPKSVGARSIIVRSIYQGQKNLSLLQHKAKAESHAMQEEISKIEHKIAAGDGDQQENIHDLQERQQQKMVKEQINSRLIIDEFKNLRGLREDLAMVETPDQLLREDRIRRIRSEQQQNRQRRYLERGQKTK